MSLEEKRPLFARIHINNITVYLHHEWMNNILIKYFLKNRSSLFRKTGF
jgi:hypothetical protein